MSDRFEDCSATLAPQRMERRRQRLLREQEELAAIERAEAKQLHKTRSRLDQVTTKIETLSTKRATPEQALAHVMEQTRQCPQRALSDWGGWTGTELNAVKEVVAMNTAQQVVNVVAKMRGEQAPEVGPLPPKQQGVRLSMEEIMRVDRMRRGEL